MRPLRAWLLRFTNLFRKSHTDHEFEAEMRSHLELHIQDNLHAGMSPEEARRQALLKLGGFEQTKEAYRDQRTLPFLETFFQDLRYGVRTMLRAPGFTAIAIVALALGIGANTAIFSVVNAVLLRPLAYKDSDRLVILLHNGYNPVSVANYLDWRDQNRSFQQMGAADFWSPNLTGIDSPEHVRGLKVTQNLFPILGIQPLLGRWFAEGEDRVGSEHEVILSYGLWQRRFSGDANVLGKTAVLNGESYVIVGVMPREFQFAPFWATHTELWVPNAFGDRIHNRGGNSLRIFARLNPGVSLEHARADIATVTARLEQQYPGTNRNVVVTPLKEKVTGDIQTPLLVLLGAVGFVLLITCANVAHMLLARASARQKEIAVRTALGARRGRVIRQFLTENLLLGMLGGSVGVLLAMWGTHALTALSPANIPRVETVSIDARVALFLLGITLLTSIGFGLAPALQSSSVNVNDTLKEGGRNNSEGASRNRLRSFLVASEFALALVLLIGAGLMIRSFFALQTIDPGFNPHNVISMVVSVAGSKEDDGNRREIFYRQLLERMRALPGVQSVGAINHLPLLGDLWGWPFTIEGRPKPRPGESPGAVYRMVTPGYFTTMRIPMIRGRDISERDTANAPDVVIINERAAHDFWPGEDPIGKRITFDDDKVKSPSWVTVIGVSKDVVEGDWALKPDPEIYLAAFQNTDFLGLSGREVASHMSYITLVVRAGGDPATLAPSMKSAVWAMDRNLAISEVQTMDSVVTEVNAQPRFEMLLLSVFAGIALVLAAVGIYGVMSYSVSRRTHEIGVRVSLGASRSDVLRLVVRQGMVLVLLGLTVGLVAASLMSRWMAHMLYGVKPTDPITFTAVAFVLAFVALLATYIPAYRATRIDPMVALRYE
jgi:putative ABC transport system permease protein